MVTPYLAPLWLRLRRGSGVDLLVERHEKISVHVER
jgi:hypothetical protein